MPKSAFHRATQKHEPKSKAKPAGPSGKRSAKPATLAQIKGACPGADSEFVMSQVEAGASLPDAKAAYIDTLAARLQNREQKLESLRRENAQELDSLASKLREELDAKSAEVKQAKITLDNVKLGAVNLDDDDPRSGRSAFSQTVRLDN